MDKKNETITVGKGVNYSVKDGELTIVIDLTKEFGLSGSGKSVVIASTLGNMELPGGVKLGLNAYKKAAK